jgi:hypothetical protein
MYIGLQVKYPLFLSDFNKTGIFWTFFFSKNTRISNFIKIRPEGAELFHAGRRSDMTKLIFAFRNFVNAPEGYKGRNEGAVCYRHPPVPFYLIHCLAYVGTFIVTSVAY